MPVLSGAHARRALWKHFAHAFLGVHLLPRARGEEPLEQLRAANAKRIVETLVRPGGVPIKRYSKCTDANLEHALNANYR